MLHARSDYNQRIQDIAGEIPADEPVWLIRGQDIAGPDTVRAWAEFVELRGGDPDVVVAAHAQANRMAAWQREHGAKVPDVPPEALR